MTVTLSQPEIDGWLGVLLSIMRRVAWQIQHQTRRRPAAIAIVESLEFVKTGS